VKTAKLGATIVLLLFVGATVGMLIAQEVSRPGTELAADDEAPGPAEETIATASASSSRGSIPEASFVSEPPSAADTTAAASPGSEANESDAGASTMQPVTSTTCVIDAIYFHNTSRCATCLKIERDAKTAIEAQFPDQLADGRLRWSAVNMEEQRQYVEQYDLVKPTVILARSDDDEPRDWVALDETWTLVRNETRFSTYIGDSVRAFLEECP
jgi:hypothetical protein